MIGDEIQTIVSALRPEDRDYIRELPEEHLIRLHHTIGRTLRNAFRSNTYPFLLTYCVRSGDSETLSFDSVSEKALKLIWEHIRQEAKMT